MVVRISDKMRYYSKVTKLLVKPNLYYQDVPGTLDEVIDKIDFERLKRVRK